MVLLGGVAFTMPLVESGRSPGELASFTELLLLTCATCRLTGEQQESDESSRPTGSIQNPPRTPRRLTGSRSAGSDGQSGGQLHAGEGGAWVGGAWCRLVLGEDGGHGHRGSDQLTQRGRCGGREENRVREQNQVGNQNQSDWTYTGSG